MTFALCLALSAHVSLPGDWNWIHPCVRLEHGAFIAGVFLNSEDRASAYAGIEFAHKNLFAEFGAVTGYSDADVLPFVRAGVKFDNGTRLFIAPAYAKGDVGAVLGLEFSLKRD